MADYTAQVQAAKTAAILDAIGAPNDVTTTTVFHAADGARNAAGDLLIAVRLVVTRYAPDADGTAGRVEVKAEELTRATSRHIAGWHPLPPEVARVLAFRALSI